MFGLFCRTVTWSLAVLIQIGFFDFRDTFRQFVLLVFVDGEWLLRIRLIEIARIETLLTNGIDLTGSTWTLLKEGSCIARIFVFDHPV